MSLGDNPGGETSTGEDRWRVAPVLPSDAFAAAALLLDLSGACHHVVRTRPEKVGGASVWKRNLVVDDAIIKNANDAGKEWKNVRPSALAEPIAPPRKIQECWDNILRVWSEPVFRKMKPSDEYPPWWSHALFLLMAADQAAAGAGFPRAHNHTSAAGKPFFNNVYDVLLWAEHEGAAGGDPSGTLATVRSKAAHTISNVPPSIANVLPKARTPPLGCTLRSLSHHLALLPPEGRARAAWHLPVDDFKLREATEPLNVLLVPYPFSVPASGFVADTHQTTEMDWNWFGLDHRAWMGHDETAPGAFVDQFLTPLATAACKKSGTLHGLIMPESAICYDTFKHLCELIVLGNPPWNSIDFIVCGLRNDERRQQGNFAAAAVFASEPVGGRRMFLINSQQKHHRWRLDTGQILTYGLGASLSSHEPWWESIELLSRSLNVYAFRRGAVFAPLICEDLARVDPVHDLIRALGPNLVIALLMDGGQVSGRWTGRAAMGLADDPGSSVMTVTSYGLVARANERLSIDKRTNSIGLWRDQDGPTNEINIDPGASGVILSLSGERVTERTLEGRSDNRKAVRLTLSDQTCVFLDGPDWEGKGWATPKNPPWKMPK